ncbi:MAG: hypothetical protein F6J86_26010 [Symploca sp. SIO1B1]|nr:hypothetical protein [Symploca sp. SIO1B1]
MNFSFGLYQRFRPFLLVSCTLATSVIIDSAALADYKPPSDQIAPSDYLGQGGSR